MSFPYIICWKQDSKFLKMKILCHITIYKYSLILYSQEACSIFVLQIVNTFFKKPYRINIGLYKLFLFTEVILCITKKIYTPLRKLTLLVFWKEIYKIHFFLSIYYSECFLCKWDTLAIWWITPKNNLIFHYRMKVWKINYT